MKKLFLMFLFICATAGIERLAFAANEGNSKTSDPEAIAAADKWIPACISNSKYSSRVSGRKLENLCECASNSLPKIYSATEITMITKMMASSSKAFSEYPDLKWMEEFNKKAKSLDKIETHRLYLDNLMQSPNGRILFSIMSKKELFDDEKIKEDCLAKGAVTSKPHWVLMEVLPKYEGEVDGNFGKIQFKQKIITKVRFELSGNVYYRNKSIFSGKTFGSFSKYGDGRFEIGLTDFWLSQRGCSIAEKINGTCKPRKKRRLSDKYNYGLSVDWNKSNNSTPSPIFKKNYTEKFSTEELDYASSLEIFIPPLDFGKRYAVGDDIYSGVNFDAYSNPWGKLRGEITGKTNFGGREAALIDFDGEYSKNKANYKTKGYGVLDIDSGVYLHLSTVVYEENENPRNAPNLKSVTKFDTVIFDIEK